METTMYSLRILSKGRVADLSQGFKPWRRAILRVVRPKTTSMETNHNNVM